MTWKLDTVALPDAIIGACQLIEEWGHGYVANTIVDKGRVSAERIRQIDGDEEISKETLEDAQTALHAADRVSSDIKGTDERTAYGEYADILGAAIWGSSPAADPVRVTDKE